MQTKFQDRNRVVRSDTDTGGEIRAGNVEP